MTPFRFMSRHIVAVRSYAPGATPAGTSNDRTAVLLPAPSVTFLSSAAMATAVAAEPVGCRAAPTITLSVRVASIVNAIASVDGAESAVVDGDAASSLVSESKRPGPPKKIDAFPQNESLAPLITTLW